MTCGDCGFPMVWLEQRRDWHCPECWRRRHAARLRRGIHSLLGRANTSRPERLGNVLSRALAMPPIKSAVR